MKQHEAKQFLPIIQAWADGKTIQVKDCGGNWNDAEDLSFSGSLNIYRIAPEPKLRAWKPGEVPFGAIVRQKGHGNSDPCGQMITKKDSSGKTLLGNGRGGDEWYSPKQLFDDGWVHSIDQGKTWHRCGVEE